MALNVPHRLLMDVMVLYLLYFICYFICFVTGILIRKCFLKSTSLILRIWPQAEPFHEENYSSFLLEWLCNWRWPNCRYNNVCRVKSLIWDSVFWAVRTVVPVKGIIECSHWNGSTATVTWIKRYTGSGCFIL